MYNGEGILWLWNRSIIVSLHWKSSLTLAKLTWNKDETNQIKDVLFYQSKKPTHSSLLVLSWSYQSPVHSSFFLLQVAFPRLQYQQVCSWVELIEDTAGRCRVIMGEQWRGMQCSEAGKEKKKNLGCFPPTSSLGSNLVGIVPSFFFF